MLIVYTPGTGRATTGTNQWGYEVVVEDGYVVAAGGNNSPIPQNGFVVSAHGASIPWLQENAPVGARVTLNGRELRITVDAESHKRLAAEVLRYTEEVSVRLGHIPVPARRGGILWTGPRLSHGR